MQLVGTREVGHQGGRVGVPGLAGPRRPGSDRRMGPAVPAQAPGADDAGCSGRERSGGPTPIDHGQRSAASPGTRRERYGSTAPHRRGVRRLDRRDDHLGTLGAEHVVEATTELGVPVADEERTCRRRSASIKSRLRACWVTQAPSGLAVTPARWTRRVSSSMKNSTYNRRSQTVSTVKKSQVRMPAACWRRNARHVVAVGRGVGSSP